MNHSRRREELSAVLERLEDRITRTRANIEDIRDKCRVDRYKFGEEEDALKNRINRMGKEWGKQRREYKLSQYSDAFGEGTIIGAAQQQLFPSQVRYEQEVLLCQYLHLIEVHEKELKRVNAQNAAIIRLMKRQIKEIQEEKTSVEVLFMNRLCSVDNQINIINGNYRKVTGSDMLSKSTEPTLSLNDDDCGGGDDNEGEGKEQEEEEMKETMASVVSNQSTGSWLQSMFGFSTSTLQTKKQRSNSNDTFSVSLNSVSALSSSSGQQFSSPAKLKRIVTPPTPMIISTNYNRKLAMTTPEM